MASEKEIYRELKELLERMYGVKLPEEPPEPLSLEERLEVQEKFRQAAQDPEFLRPQSGEEDM